MSGKFAKNSVGAAYVTPTDLVQVVGAALYKYGAPTQPQSTIHLALRSLRLF